MVKRFSLIPFVFGDWDKDFSRMLEHRFDLPAEVGEWSPRVDIIEKPDRFIVKADIPGVDTKNIHITVDRNNIQIRGEKETQHKEESKDYVHFERFQGSFSRTIALPAAIEADKIKAKSKNGVLEITVPKAQKGAGTKQIAVEEE